jgi:hypothetical protein
MKIYFTLYEDGGIDPIDPVGDIILTDGQTEIQVKATYLDSWFEVLIDGLEGCQEGKKLQLEIPEEPDLLAIKPFNSGIKLSYGNKEIIGENFADFKKEIIRNAQEFLIDLNLKNIGNIQNPVLRKIQEFVKKERLKQVAVFPK